MSWRDAAACRGTFDPVFFPAKGGNQFTTVARAKAICRSCPVTAECLDYALNYGERNGGARHGIFGGLTERERRKLKKRMEAA